jgi:GH15 family glucan-1,4-alpha-glucosidase
MFHETSNAVKWRNTTNEIYENVSMLWNNSRSYFYRGFRRHTDGRTDYDETIDLASFYGAWAFGLFDHDKLDVAYNTFMSRFNLGGYNIGAPRFEGDDYNGYENPWFITSFWLAQYKMSLSDKDLARKALDWANGQIARTNILPEQVNPKDGAMLSAAPLSWSHAEFVNTCLDFGNEGRGDAISA